MSASEVFPGGEQSNEGASRVDVETEAQLEAGLSHHQAGRAADAERTYRGVLEKDPDHPVALHLLGLLLDQQGQHDLAVELIRRSLEQDPEYAAAHYDLGNILRDRGRDQEAELAFRRAVELWPDWPEAQYNYGLLLEARGKLGDAATAYRSAIAAKQDYSKALLCLAAVLRKQGDLFAAVASYQQALSFTPDSAEAHNNLGIVLNEQGKSDEAVASYQKALSCKPDYAEAYYNRGNALANLKRHEAALESHERAIALKPDYAAAHGNRGNVLADLKRDEAALESYAQAIALKPGYAEAYSNRGNALTHLKRHEAALESYTQAIVLKPDFADAHNNRGHALRALNRPAEAIAAYRQALENGGDAEQIRYMLAALGADSLPRAAPSQLVTSLFNDYADRFDQHLTGTLKYQTPALLCEQITRFCSSRNLDILDLGCGTGLLGPLLRPLARTLTGVDLSPNMLEKARQREIYDDLSHAELSEFLQTRHKTFDLAVAADVFVYIGDLAGVFAGVRDALKPGGWFAYSVEASEGADFVLGPTRRYAHSAAYLEKLAGDHGFVVTSIEPGVIRQEREVDVKGYLVLMSRGCPSC